MSNLGTLSLIQIIFKLHFAAPWKIIFRLQELARFDLATFQFQWI